MAANQKKKRACKQTGLYIDIAESAIYGKKEISYYKWLIHQSEDCTLKTVYWEKIYNITKVMRYMSDIQAKVIERERLILELTNAENKQTPYTM